MYKYRNITYDYIDWYSFDCQWSLNGGGQTKYGIIYYGTLG